MYWTTADPCWARSGPGDRQQYIYLIQFLNINNNSLVALNINLSSQLTDTVACPAFSATIMSSLSGVLSVTGTPRTGLDKLCSVT